MNKQVFALGMVVTLAVTLASRSVSAVEVDGIVAQVGSATILRSEVYEELRRMGATDESQFNEVRNQLIERKLVLQAAAESKMTMQEWVVEGRIREIIKRGFGGDRNKLIEALGKQQLSYPEWYAHMKDDMIVGAMRWNVVDKNVTASPAAMQAEYAAHPERYTSDHKVTVCVILLKPEEKSRRAEISEALKTTDFEALGGRKYANIVPEDIFKPEVVQEIDKMPKGTISHWIEIDDWSFLLRKDDETIGKRLTFEEAYDQIEAQVKEDAARRLYQEWIERLRAETYIKVF